MSTSFALNRKANQIAQSQPEIAAELRLRAFYQPATAKRVVAVKAQTTVSRTALFSKANGIAQAKPKLAAQLRLQAAYA